MGHAGAIISAVGDNGRREGRDHAFSYGLLVSPSAAELGTTVAPGRCQRVSVTD